MTDQRVDETEAVVSPKWPLWPSRRELTDDEQRNAEWEAEADSYVQVDDGPALSEELLRKES